MIDFGPYRKTVAALVVGLIGWATLVVQSSSSSITSGEWIAFGDGRRGGVRRVRRAEHAALKSLSPWGAPPVPPSGP